MGDIAENLSLMTLGIVQVASLGVVLSVVLGISILAFWKPNAVLFMILAGISIVFGFYWYDAFTTNLGLTLGLMLVAYAIFCIGMAFRVLFWRQNIED